MFGPLLQQARKDAAMIASSGGFQVDIIISTPDDLISLAVTGLATGTWITFDDTTQGRSINSLSNSINIPEQTFIDSEYPYKNTRDIIDLRTHKVHLVGVGSLSGYFTITENHANATLGLIICMLGRYSV